MAKTQYKTEYCQKLKDYFSWFLVDHPEPMSPEDEKKAKEYGRYPSMVGFAKMIGVTTRTLRNWRKNEKFDEACEFADEIQDEVLNERALFGDVDGRVAMKIRELKTNARKNGDGEGGSGSKLVINLNDDKGAERIEIKKWAGEINEDTEY